jgi:hypothetical protein
MNITLRALLVLFKVFTGIAPDDFINEIPYDNNIITEILFMLNKHDICLYSGWLYRT